MKIQLDQIDNDTLKDLAECIGRLATEMFSDPKIQEEFEQWKEKKTN